MPEHYGRFLCGVFDAWYDQLQRGNYVSVRNFEDYLRILLGMRLHPALPQAPVDIISQWKAMEAFIPVTFMFWMSGSWEI